MTILIFNHRFPYLDDAIRVQVQFNPPSGVPFLVSAVVDTGAWTSLFDKALASLLGITDLTTGAKVPVTPANGSREDGYAFPIGVTVQGRSLTIPIVFVPAWPEGITNLLGMRGFLDQFGPVAIDHRTKMLFHN